jgi:neutral ceramidase
MPALAPGGFGPRPAPGRGLTFTIELGNGYNGYLPTPEQHRLGDYETWRARSSYLEVEASRRITEVVLDLLKEVAW